MRDSEMLKAIEDLKNEIKAVKAQVSESKRRTQFKSKADAFTYMISYLCEEQNLEYTEAIKQASEFAETIAKSASLPDIAEEKSKSDSLMGEATKWLKFADQNPKIVDAVIGVGGFLAGLVVSDKKSENNAPEQISQSTQTNNNEIDQLFQDESEQ